MYNYLFQSPAGKQMGWHNEVQGVCHDENNWYFSQHKDQKDGVLWCFPVSHRLGDECKEANPEKGILRMEFKGPHFGDIDYYKGYVFIPSYKGDHFGIAVVEVKKDATGKATGFNCVNSQELLKPNKTKFESIGWCAVNPKDGRLYLSDKHCKNSYSKEHSPILVYDIDLEKIKSGGSFLTYVGYFSLLDENGKALEIKHMQGGTFDNSNHLHLVNGYNKLSTSKSGISVFTISCVNGVYQKPIRIAKSVQGKEKINKFRYQFSPDFPKYEEPEGITYWDLTDGRAPEIGGVLHAIMLDNGIMDKYDKFYFKHYSLL